MWFVAPATGAQLNVDESRAPIGDQDCVRCPERQWVNVYLKPQLTPSINGETRARPRYIEPEGLVAGRNDVLR